MTTQQALTKLIARRRQAINNSYPSVLGGVVKVTAYDAETGVYTSPSGVMWEFKGDALKPVYGADFLAEEAANREKADVQNKNG